MLPRSPPDADSAARFGMPTIRVHETLRLFVPRRQKQKCVSKSGDRTAWEGPEATLLGLAHSDETVSRYEKHAWSSFIPRIAEGKHGAT